MPSRSARSASGSGDLRLFGGDVLGQTVDGRPDGGQGVPEGTVHHLELGHQCSPLVGGAGQIGVGCRHGERTLLHPGRPGLPDRGDEGAEAARRIGVDRVGDAKASGDPVDGAAHVVDPALRLCGVVDRSLVVGPRRLEPASGGVSHLACLAEPGAPPLEQFDGIALAEDATHLGSGTVCRESPIRHDLLDSGQFRLESFRFLAKRNRSGMQPHRLGDCGGGLVRSDPHRRLCGRLGGGGVVEIGHGDRRWRRVHHPEAHRAFVTGDSTLHAARRPCGGVMRRVARRGRDRLPLRPPSPPCVVAAPRLRRRRALR